MDTIYWGINQKNNKRKANDDIYLDNPKKRKLIMVDSVNKNIYTIGTEIHFTDSINSRTIEILIKAVTKIINKNHKEYEHGDDKLQITIVVDSGGGSVIAVLKWVDFVNRCKKKYPYVEFISICTGIAASAATTLACVCHKRMATSRSTLMIHQLRSSTEGKFTELISYSKHLTTLHDTLVEIYLEHSKLQRDELEVLLKNETWITPTDYKKMGLIDEII